MLTSNHSLKILFLLQDVPFPISDGMRWKVFHLLKYLSSRHQCDVLAFSDSTPDLRVLAQSLPDVNWLGTFEKVRGPLRILKGAFYLFSGRPVSLARYSSGKFNNRLCEVIGAQKYDVLHCDIVNMAQYWRGDIATVHSPNDATSLFYSRMAQNAKGQLTKWRLQLGANMLQRYERLVYPRFTKVHVVSRRDAEYLRENIPSADIAFIPFGVDGEKLPTKNVFDKTRTGHGQILILVLGGANVPGVAAGIQEFVEEVIPEVQGRFPKAVFRIQGRETDELLQRLKVGSAANVSASNWVEDLDALIQEATLVVLPDKAGTGIKTRALQALACGATIVGTRVAFEGLRDHVEDGIHCAIADDVKGLSQKLCDLLIHEDKRCAIGAAAAIIVRSRLSWAELGQEYEALYVEAMVKHCSERAPRIRLPR